MNTTIAKTEPLKQTKPSAINALAARMSVEPTKLYESLKATVFKNATNEELLALVVVANEYGLNPFLKEIYAFPAKGGGITPIVSVDGWNKMLLRQQDYNGKKFAFAYAEDGSLISCTATIYVKGREYPEECTEYFSECQRNTDNWKNMPHRMLRNRTLCQATRLAFGFAGIYHEEEIGEIIDETASATPSIPATPLKTIVAVDSKTPNAELESVITTAGHSFALLVKWADETGNLDDASSFPSFADLPKDFCKRMLTAKVGLLKSLGEMSELKKEAV